jgi:hypothetical protein
MIRHVCWMLLAICFVLGPGLTHSQVSNQDYEPLLLPSGELFPGSEAELLRARDKHDGNAIRKMRSHAWDVFAGLVAGNQPIWNTWYTKCDVHLALTRCLPQANERTSGNRRFLQSLEVPVQSLNLLQGLVPEARFDDPGSSASARSLAGPHREALVDFVKSYRKRPQTASVLFNQEARDNILNNCLYPAKNFSTTARPSTCPPVPAAPGKVAVFPRGSVVVKTVWAVVGPNGDTIPYAYRAELWNELHSEQDKPL